MALDHYKMHPYSKLYLVPIVNDDVPLLFDGVRATNKDFQKDIDTLLRTFLKDKRIDYIELPLPNPKDIARQEWLKIITENTLKDLGKKTLFDF